MFLVVYGGRSQEDRWHGLTGVRTQGHGCPKFGSALPASEMLLPKGRAKMRSLEETWAAERDWDGELSGCGAPSGSGAAKGEEDEKAGRMGNGLQVYKTVWCWESYWAERQQASRQPPLVAENPEGASEEEESQLSKHGDSLSSPL